MTISTINPFSGYDATRLEQLEQQRQETQKAATAQQDSTGADRISISEEGRLKANMLKVAQDSDGVRTDKVAEFKARIEAGQYKPSGRDIATDLVRKELDVWG